MSEGIIIALITAIGSLLSGIVGQIIAANATIKAAAIKQKADEKPLSKEIDNKSRRGGAWQGFLGGALIGAIIIFSILKMTGYIPPFLIGEKFVTKLLIPSNNNLGVTYNIPEDGVYTFKYSDSAVSGWGTADNGEARWHTTIVCFRGNNVVWNGVGVDGEKAVFQIGTGKSYKTKKEAIKSSSGQEGKAGFQTGEQVTCVVGDGRYDFGDNGGEVFLDVFVSH